MKTLYIECKAGVAGDMLMAALWDICEKQQQFTEKMNGLMEGLHVRLDKKLCGGIECAAAHVTIHGVSEESGGHSRQHDEHHEGEHAHPHHQHTSCLLYTSAGGSGLEADKEQPLCGCAVHYFPRKCRRTGNPARYCEKIAKCTEMKGEEN